MYNLIKKPHPAISISAVFLLIITGLLIYANTFDSPFVFDDKPNIVENPYIRMTEISFKQIVQINNGPAPNRPVPNLTFALNYYFHQYRPTGYHLINILIHITNALLIFLIAGQTMRLCRMTSISLPSLTAALLWLVHPLHTQSVTYIVQRMNSMAAMFYLLSLLCYIRARQIQIQQPGHLSKTVALFIATVTSGFLGLASKEIVVTLPFTVFCYEWCFFQNLNFAWLKKQFKWIGVAALPALVLTFLYIGGNPLDKIVAGYEHRDFTLSERLLTQPRVVIYYISLLFFPHPARLNLDYDFSLSHSFFSPPTTALALTAITMLIIGAMIAARKHRLASFAILWFFGSLIIESSIINLEIVYEHRTYLPSVFPVIAVTTLLLQKIKYRKTILISLCVMIGMCSFYTYQRNRTWATKLTLWIDNATKTSQKARVHLNWGKALLDTGDVSQAIAILNRALDLDPSYPNAFYGLALAYQTTKQFDLAIHYYQEGILRDPDNPIAYGYLAEAFQQAGNTTEAIATYKKAVDIEPDYVPAYNNLGEVFRQAGNMVEAIAMYKKAVAIDPDCVAAYNNLGAALNEMGRCGEALTMYRKIVELKPRLADAWHNLGVLLAGQGQNDQAIDMYQRALAINPGYADAWYNLGVTLAAQGRVHQAIDTYKQALIVDPEHVGAHVNLGSLLIGRYQFQAAIPHLLEALRLAPEQKEIHTNLAITYARTGQLSKAIRHCQKALAIDPHCAAAMYNLTHIYEQIARKQPGNPVIFYNLACLYARQEKTDNAIDNFQKAIAKGYNKWSHIAQDRDLDNIRGLEAYQVIMKKAE